MTVQIHGKFYEIKKQRHLFTLNLSRKNIRDIDEILGLADITYLQKLDLSGNEITEIKGFDTLNQLVHLDLSGNRIEKLNGLGNLTNLRYLNLKGNPIFNEARRLFGVHSSGNFLNAQSVVQSSGKSDGTSFISEHRDSINVQQKKYSQPKDFQAVKNFGKYCLCCIFSIFLPLIVSLLIIFL